MRAKPDGNQDIIVHWLRWIGASVTIMDRNAGFDLLVGYRGRLYVVEIKMPGCENRLTKNEKAMKAALEAVGVSYNIISCIEAAAALVGWEAKVI
jgi:predicted Holliday junction resolvase-like endonuclease